MGKRATAVDAKVGQRIQALRTAAGLSQTELGQQIGVTSQQVQKYENGTDRVGAGRLPLVAKSLGVPIAALFEESVGKPVKRPSELSLDELMTEPRARLLVKAFCRIPEPLQIGVLQFVRSLSTATTRRRKK